MKFTTYKEKILSMRKERKSYISTLLFEALKWNEHLDEIIVLCSVLNILDKAGLGVSRNEVRKAFNKYYRKEYHGDKQTSLNWMYKEFGIKAKTATFTSQIRKPVNSIDVVSKNIVIPHTTRGKLSTVVRLLPSSVDNINNSLKTPIPLTNNTQTKR